MGRKACGAGCAYTDDPSYGCAGAACSACASPLNGYASCGASCTVCPAPALHMDATCTSGVCGSACTTGYTHCPGGIGGGCETMTDTDPLNCGACGHSCLGAACVDGACQPITVATSQSDPADLAVDATGIYWTATTGGTIVRAPLVGGSAAVLVGSQAAPKGIALDDTYVYWSNSSNVGAVRRIPKVGGTATDVATGQYYPYRIALGPTTVYWTDDSTGGDIRMAPKVGGGPVAVVAPTQSSPRGIVFDGTTLFWTTYQEVKKSAPTAAATITKLAYTEQFPFALTADATTLFWYDEYADKIRKVLKTGGTASTVSSLGFSSNHGSRQIVVDAGFVYWNNRMSDTIQKAPKSGGSPITVAAAHAPTGVAVDALFVYWTNQGDGTVMKVAK